MSITTREFYALQCDFPECGEIWEDSEHSYFWDSPDCSLAADDGWLIIDHGNQAFCAAHVVEVECPPEGFVTDAHGERYCKQCEDWGSPHLAPMPDTLANRLKIAMDRVTARAHSDLDWLGRRYRDQLDDRSSFAIRTNRALRDIWERTCKDWKPDITGTELYELERSIR